MFNSCECGYGDCPICGQYIASSHFYVRSIATSVPAKAAKKELKVRGSEAGFMLGRLVYTDYDTACLRKILLRSRDVRQPIPVLHTNRGPIYERKFGTELRKQFDSVAEECAVVVPVDGVDGVSFSGKLDYFVSGPSGSCVYELKSTESKNVLRNVIKQGIYKTENLAQLISYMIAKGTDQGQLSYAYMEKDKNDEYQIKAERKFKISIDNYGRILVDSKPSRFTVFDQISHTQHAAKVIKDGTIWDRPTGYQNAFGSPCQYCPFKSTCDSWDTGAIEKVDDFVNIARSSILGESKDG